MHQHRVLLAGLALLAAACSKKAPTTTSPTGSGATASHITPTVTPTGSSPDGARVGSDAQRWWSDERGSRAATGVRAGESEHVREDGSLPARIALRLPEVIPAGPDAATVLTSRDLVIGVDDDGAARYGLVDPLAGQSSAARQALAQLEAGSDRLQRLSGTLGRLPHERVIPGPIARALLIAIEAHGQSKEPTPLSSVMWRVQDEQVTVMLVPARGEIDVAPVGDGTSLGLEEHYVIDLREQRLLRRLRAR